MEVKEKLAMACRILGTEGHEDLELGHISTRINNQDGYMYMKGSGLCLHEVYPEDIVVVDFNYQKISGTRKPHMELPIHVEIYKARPDVNCVIHTHPLYASPFTATGERLRPVTNVGALFAKPIPYFDLTSDLIVTSEHGVALAEKLGNENVVLMKNHGIVVAEKTIEKATVTAYLLEKAARAYFIAKVFGHPTWTDDQEAEVKAKKMAVGLDNKWDVLVRLYNRKYAGA